MNPQKRRKLWYYLIPVLLIAAFIGSCKKDKYTEEIGLCPNVQLTSPLNGATGVPLNQVITVTFNVKMNPATIISSCFVLQAASPIGGSFSFNENSSTFSFVPTSPLLANTTYTGIVKTSVRDPRGNAMQKEYVWSFSTGLILAPIVSVTDPTNSEVNVPLNKVIKATFSLPMDPASIKDSSFLLKNGALAVAGVVTYTDTSAVFTPAANLLPNTVYTATITTMAKTLNKQTNLANNYVWTFTTAALVLPFVTRTDPANAATAVALNKVVKAVFSVPMDPLTIWDSTFVISNGINLISGTVTYTDTTASFTPLTPLLPNTLYTATIKTGAKNIAGTAIGSNYTWSFTTLALVAPTVTSTDPTNLATNVLLNKVLTANFSEAMDPLTLSNLTFTLKLGIVPVAGTVNYSGTAATFTPTVNLLSGNTYTATITTGAKNLAGVPIASDYVWTFNTKAPAGPLPPDLKSVARFGIIAGVGVSNNAGFSVINNQDVGISPGARTGVTGFPPAIIVGGAIYASDDIAPPGTPAMLVQAKQDLTDAYLFAAAAVLPAPATVSGDQGGTTLAPGIYKSTSTLLIQNGNLTSDAQGDVNAVWIFQVSSALTTVGGAGGSVILTGGAQAKNVYWQSGSSVTIGDNTSFKGNLLVLTSITLNSNATLQGRVLCRNGAVVLTSTNIINKP